jgi:hypothetical protein
VKRLLFRGARLLIRQAGFAQNVLVFNLTNLLSLVDRAG